MAPSLVERGYLLPRPPCTLLGNYSVSILVPLALTPPLKNPRFVMVCDMTTGRIHRVWSASVALPMALYKYVLWLWLWLWHLYRNFLRIFPISHFLSFGCWLGVNNGIWPLTRGQSNLTKSASWGGPIPRLGVTPGGRKLYHWIPGVGFPISVP